MSLNAKRLTSINDPLIELITSENQFWIKKQNKYFKATPSLSFIKVDSEDPFDYTKSVERSKTGRFLDIEWTQEMNQAVPLLFRQTQELL